MNSILIRRPPYHSATLLLDQVRLLRRADDPVTAPALERGGDRVGADGRAVYILHEGGFRRLEPRGRRQHRFGCRRLFLVFLRERGDGQEKNCDGEE